MKKVEKRVIGITLAALAGIVVLAVYLEMQTQTGTMREKLAGPSGKALSQTSIIPKGINPDALPDPTSQGAKALTLYCIQCHDLPTPAMHTAEEWNRVLNRMQDRMHSQRGSVLLRIMVPPKRDWEALQHYLTEYAQKPMDKSKLSDLDTPAGRAFHSICSQCHAPPDPKLHTAKEWPRTVIRMKSNMIAARKHVPDQETIDTIISYLQKHSKDDTTQ